MSGGFCTNCGAQLSSADRFCASCGYETQVAPPPQRPAPAPLRQSAQASSPLQSPARRHGAAILVGVMAAVVIAGAAMLVLLLDRPSSGEAPAFADLTNEPQITWTFDAREHFAEVADLPEQQQVYAGVLASVQPEMLAVVVQQSGEGDLPLQAPRLYGVHSESGEVRWTSPPLQTEGSLAINVSCSDTTGPVLPCVLHLDSGGQQVIAIDAGDGSLLWSSETSFAATARAIGDDIVVATVDDEANVAIERRDGATGEPSWSFTERVSMASTPWLEVSDGYVLASVDAAYFGLRHDSGDQMSWLSTWDENESFYLVGDIALRQERFTDGATLERLDDEGTAVWSHYFEQGASFCLGQDRSAPLMVCDDDSGFVRALDWDSGDELWASSWNAEQTSAGHAGTVNISYNEDRLSAIDLRTGKQMWQQSSMGESSWVFPVVGDQLVYVQSETGFKAYDVTDGAETWTTSELRDGSGGDIVSITEMGGRLVGVGDNGSTLHGLS